MGYATFKCSKCGKTIVGEAGQVDCAACQHAVPAGTFSTLVLAQPAVALQWHWAELTNDQFATALTRAPAVALRHAQSRMSVEEIERARRLAKELELVAPTAASR